MLSCVVMLMLLQFADLQFLMQGALKYDQAEEKGEGWQMASAYPQGSVLRYPDFKRWPSAVRQLAAQVKAMTEDEMFKILRSGKRKKKADLSHHLQTAGRFARLSVQAGGGLEACGEQSLVRW